MKKLLAMGIAGALATGLSLAAFAQGGATNEVSTAHAHALMAQSATSLTTAHAHLHHVVNCLVGPKGAGFDAKAEDPCKGQGNGAIPDSASNEALHSKLQTALGEAQAGLKSDSLASVHQDASKVAATLQDTGTPAKKASGGYSW
ncbi:MAG: hypothetical protein EPN36_00955 [Rhodanobacteraceae bacterium]|nr:MAG: hypothetical protein EPN36_00955 [Rhodanobacteraceae bacterium]